MRGRMPVHRYRFALAVVTAFIASSVAASVLVKLQTSCVQSPILIGCIRAFRAMKAEDYLHALENIATISIAAMVITLIPVAVFLIAAWRFKWTGLKTFAFCGGAIGPVIWTGIMSFGNFDLDPAGVVFFYVTLAWVGAVAASVFWLIVRRHLPWRRPGESAALS